jgi:hypothetical protein
MLPQAKSGVQKQFGFANDRLEALNYHLVCGIAGQYPHYIQALADDKSPKKMDTPSRGL